MGALKLARLTAYASLGPITGPLVAGVVRNLSGGDHIGAGLYALAIPAAYVLMAAAGAHLAGLA